MVQKCLSESHEKWGYDPKYSHYKQSGSGNNWALGYYYYSESEYEITHTKIQSLLEKIDYFSGFQVFQSLAGGTGSGLGAHIVEKLREDFPKSRMINIAIWPYSTGEVILQNYNVLLTLHSLLCDSDTVLPIYNDDILLTCRTLLKQPRPSYKVMNTVIARQILGVMFPVANTEKSEA